MTRAKLLLLIFVVQSFLLPGFCTDDADNEKEETLKRVLPAYAIISNTEPLNSTRCRKELEEFREAVDQRHLWSLKVLDSSGEPVPGFMYGNNYWLGSRSQCEDAINRTPLTINMKVLANNSKYRDVEDEFPPFEFQYFVVYFKHNSTLQYHVTLPNDDLITLGVCLPASCTTNELAAIMQNIFNNRTLLFGKLFSTDFKLVEVKDLRDDSRWLISGAHLVVGLIFMVTCLLMVVGTTYDIILLKRNKKKRKEFLNFENNNGSIQMNTKQSPEDPENQEASLKPQSILGQTLQAYSVYTNTKVLFDAKLTPSSIPAIHGVRFLGMLWIIMVHTLFYMSDVADNKVTSWRKSEGFAAQVISNSTLSVDTFFFLGGFLLTQLYLTSKEFKGEHRLSYFDKAKNFLLALLKRFIRLTPAYMMALGLFQINSTWYGKTSVFYMSERGQEVCPKYWWRNILYIQNLFSRDTMCMSWSWYLANDMQFFAIGFLLLLLSSTHFNLVISLLTILLIGSAAITGYISYIYKYVPTLDQQYHLLDVLYDPPWTRIGPYVVGMITAYINVKLDKKLPVGKRTLVILWILGSSCNLAVLFGLTKRQISVLASAFYSALSRTIWAVGIGWILIACGTNHAGMINRFLSFKVWVPFSRLTYCAYLLNPILITSIYLYGETSVHVDFLRTGVIFLASFTASYFCAYIFTLMFETPYVVLMRQRISSLDRKM